MGRLTRREQEIGKAMRTAARDELVEWLQNDRATSMIVSQSIARAHKHLGQAERCLTMITNLLRKYAEARTK